MRALKSAATFYRRHGRRVTPAPAAPHIKTSIGEIGIHEGGRQHVLRPSLFAMSQLGEPDEIVSLLANVCGDPFTAEEGRLQHLNAVAVLAACTDDDISHLTGYHDGAQFVPGKMERGVAIVLARRLLCHGVTGTLPEPDRPEGTPAPEYSSTFEARSFVALGMAHLGLSENDAWNMTMTGLVGAMRSKYPPPTKASQHKGPSKKELIAALEWHNKVKSARSVKNG